MMDIVIIDDEVGSRELLSLMLQEISPDLQIIGMGSGINEALQLIKTSRPHVIFLDVCLADGNAFELLAFHKSLPCLVVLITGNKDYAARAFDYSVFDFILKPFEKLRLQQTVYRLFNSYVEEENESAELMPMQNKVSSFVQKKIPVHVGTRVILLNICDILFLKAMDGNTHIRTKKNDNYIIGRQLSDFEFLVKFDIAFMRVNKSTIINIDTVVSYSKGQVYLVYLVDGTELEISRRKKSELLNLLGLHSKLL